ncbi:MAG: hypothetical protein CL927_05480 [Deltaproteobacteria bacterium]|nr:hypothetical protein [Deltaproteobacteria bacterium]
MKCVSWTLVVLLALLLARTWSAVSGYDVVADVHPSRAGLEPDLSHLLGTDALGRDVFCRLMRATDAFVVPGIGAAVVAVGLGGTLGTLAGWVGGWTDRTMSAAGGLPSTMPRFILVLLLATIFSPSSLVLALGCGLAFVPVVTTEVRVRVSDMRRKQFVIAGLMHGLSITQVLGRHILWSTCRHVLARLALQAAGFFVVVETSLAYLGDIGVQEPIPSWGNMVASGLVDGRLHWVARLAPAVALWLVLAALAQLERGLQNGEERVG